MAAYQVKQSTTTYALVFFMADSLDHVSAKTGLAPTVTLSKNGGAFGAAAGAVTEIANGFYKVAGNATDTGTLGPLLLHASATGADPTDAVYEVVSYDPQDAAALGLSRLDAAVSSRLASASYTAPDNADIATILTRTDVATSTRSSHSAADVWAVGTRTLTSFGTLVADVWASATRVLTAGTNIVLAKGTGVTGFTDLDAAGVRTAVGLASANLDTQLDALPTNAELATALGTADDAVLAAIAALNNLSMANVRTAVGLGSANLDTQLAAIAGFVDTEVGAIQTDVTTLLSRLSALRAGYLDNLDATVSSRLAASGYTAPDNASIATVLTRTDVATSTRLATADYTAPSTPPTANAVADALLDRADAIETGWTVRKVFRVMAAALGGKVSGAATTTVTIRDLTDTKDRIVATTDAQGDRTAITLDGD